MESTTSTTTHQRKRLGSGKLVDIRQDGLERILFLDFECVNELGDLVTVTLACEIMGRCSNLVIICGGKVVDSIKRVDEDMSRERLVLPGENYTMMRCAILFIDEVQKCLITDLKR